MPTPLNGRRLAVVLTLVALSGAGCRGTLYSATGDVMSSYAVEYMVPEMMASDDVAMACEVGVSMGPFLMSFKRVTDDPNRAALVTLLSAGMCAEDQAWEAELASMRALRQGAGEASQDARIREQRAHTVAAKRFYAAYRRLEALWGPVGEQCPKLEEKDELTYLLGLSSGLLALVHDRQSGGQAGVPMSIPPAVARAAACLPEGSWWGAPEALRAAIWTSVPGAAPEGSDPWAILQDAAKKGDAAHVRLARAFLAQAAAGAGKTDLLKEAIVDQAAALAAHPADPDYALLDRYGTLIVLHESDKLWTRETGHRTPAGAFGTFASEATPQVDDSLLEGLDEE